jgi:cytochrome c oxidase assembly factor CtaG
VLAHGQAGAHPWHAEATVLVPAAIAAILFVQALVRLRRRRPDLAPLSRALLFGAGLSVVLVALESPLDSIGEEELLSAHMLQHALVGDLGPALLVTAVRGPLVVFLLPAAILAPLARLGWLRAALRFLVRPATALAVWGLVYGLWHVPGLYDRALRSDAVHALEHASFFVAGILVWMVIVDPARRGELSRARRLAVVVCLFGAGQVLADVLIFSFTPLYPAYAVVEDRPLDISAVTDQQLAGLVMMVEQALTLGTAAVLLLVPMLRGRRVSRLAAHA